MGDEGGGSSLASPQAPPPNPPEGTLCFAYFLTDNSPTGSYRAAQAERNAEKVAAAPLAWWNVLPLWQKVAAWGTSVGIAVVADALQTWIIVAGTCRTDQPDHDAARCHP